VPAPGPGPGQYAAHDDFLHVRGSDAAASDRAGNCGSAELRRGGRGEHALERADGGTRGGSDDDLELVHEDLLLINRGHGDRDD